MEPAPLCRAGVQARLHPAWSASGPGTTGTTRMPSMSISAVSVSALRRRGVLQAGAACAVAGFTGRASAALGSIAAGSEGRTTELKPGPARIRMVGDEAPATAVWTYNGVEPGPVLRLRQAVPFRAVVENRLSEATTVHWHGIRVPNAMDGVPGLTQHTVPPEGHFDYAFTPPDAGTFWYHSHDDSLVQMGRGLAGALIVEEREPP
jgi:FtsP/CotA-like multicopper oxidase with cupredoxin domain